MQGARGSGRAIASLTGGVIVPRAAFLVVVSFFKCASHAIRDHQLRDVTIENRIRV